MFVDCSFSITLQFKIKFGVLTRYKGNLPNVVIPLGVIEIYERAFADCKSLQSVTIPETVTKIGEQAFANCSSLRSIIIPDNVSSVGRNAFEGCYNLITAEVPRHLSLSFCRLPDSCSIIRR